MTNNTWKLAGLAILVIGLAAALISITTEKILVQKAAGINGSGSSRNTNSGQSQKTQGQPDSKNYYK